MIKWTRLVAWATTILVFGFCGGRFAHTDEPPELPHELEHIGLRRSLYPLWIADTRREAVVELGLTWLAAHQSSDGRWAARGSGRWCDGVEGKGTATGDAETDYDIGLTGLSLLAFLGAGYVPQGDHPFGETVERGLAYLLAEQDEEGFLGIASLRSSNYMHAYAAQALIEAYGLLGTKRLRRASQGALDYVCYAQNPYFGWRYGVKPGDNDTSMTAVMVLPLQQARRLNAAFERRGQAVPLKLDEEDVFDGAQAWFEKMTDPDSGRVGYLSRGGCPARPETLLARFPAEDSECPTALATVCRFLGLRDPRGTEVSRPSIRLIVGCFPRWAAGGSIDLYYWYYGALAMRQFGRGAWSTWRDHLHHALISNQRTDGDRCGFRGSWDPVGPWGLCGGRVYSTSIALLALLAESRFFRSADRTLEGCEDALEKLQPFCRGREPPSQAVLDALLCVSEAYHWPQPPLPPEMGTVPKDTPAGDREKVEKELRREHKKKLSVHQRNLKAWQKSLKKLRRQSVKAYVAALFVPAYGGEGVEGLHIRAKILAARLVGLTGSADAAAALRKNLQSKVLGSERDMNPVLWEEILSSLVRLADSDTVTWLARNVPARSRPLMHDVPRAVSALSCMRRFVSIPARERLRATQALIKRYGPLEEDAASGRRTDVWAALKAEVVATLAYLARSPQGEDGAPLPTVKAYAEWVALHGDPGSAPWAE